MKIHQISLFLENKPGHIYSICRTLGDAGINIETLALADTAQFGILRLIVKDWEKAKAILDEAGFVANVTEVVAMEVPDQPGGLADLLADLADTGINIEYMFAFSPRQTHPAVMVFRFDDPDAAIRRLAEKGRNVLGHVDLFA